MNIDELNNFVPGLATPSDVGPLGLLTTIVCFTTYPLIQSLGRVGACYNHHVAPIASVAPNTRNILHTKYGCALLGHITIG